MNLEMDHKFPRLFPGDTMVKNPPANARDTRHGFDPWVGKIPLKKRMATRSLPVFLLGKSHRQRSLVGYSPWGHKGSDTTEHACIHHVFYKYPGGRLILLERVKCIIGDGL